MADRFRLKVEQDSGINSGVLSHLLPQLPQIDFVLSKQFLE
jgi:hypothetical protein